MNSKERVLCSIAREVPDRVPLDFSANPAMLARLGREYHTTDHKQLLTAMHSDILDMRGVVDPLYRGPIPYQKDLGDGIRENFWGWRTTMKQTVSGSEEMYCDFVLQRAQSIEELKQHNWPQAGWFDFSDLSVRLSSWGNFAIMASGASVWQHPSFLRGLDVMLGDLILQPEMAEYVMDRFCGFYLDYFDAMFCACPGQIDILRIADDLGMQDRLLISPELFERFIAPRIRSLVDMAHSHNVKVMFHSCGSIVPILDSLIQTGVDILDPIQVSAKDMDPGYLKETFGHRICFHGSIDTQDLLPQGSSRDVAETVKEMIRILGREGGFILAPSHVLQTDVPVENVKVLYQTAYEYQNVSD